MERKGCFYHSFSPLNGVLEKANQRMNGFVIGLGVVVFLYGIFLPENWVESFGVLAIPIDWAARTVPATVKAAAVSPISELVRGFFGFGFWAVFGFVFLLVWKDPLGARIKFAFGRGKSFWNTFVFFYLIGIPGVILILYVFFFLPVGLDSVKGATWGMRLIMTMLSGRVALSLLGAVSIMGAGGFLFVFIVQCAGPICLLFEGKRK